MLAGPTCTQLLGDLGADVIKLEHPERGDDTRRWGPPFLQDADGHDTGESAYYQSANRNKRSVSVDFASDGGRSVVERLLERADVFVENFKLGSLERFELDYAAVTGRHPGLVYCSISGFGRTGPRAAEPGYDFLIQALGGIMSLTGEPEGEPMKVGVPIADITCGVYAAVGILAALRHRDATGRGQHLDLSLFDTQVAWLGNAALDYFTSGSVPARYGNAHPHVVPYQVFATADSHLVVAVGNDAQFARLCECVGKPELAGDERFATNAGRVRHRDALLEQLVPVFAGRDREHWLRELAARNVSAGPVRDLAEVFADPHSISRGLRVTMDQPAAGSGLVDVLANPLRLSDSPVRYALPPPTLGQHTDEVLTELGYDAHEIAALRRAGAI